ncbi:MAG: DNA-binding transcriptional regulator YiaG [Enterobacterales bacterium]|jgi:DNA-binding transcriptional regulator YiaG
MMISTNSEAEKIIADFELSHAQVAQYLNVSTDTVKCWFEIDDSNNRQEMPTKELHFLKYCLMADNKRSQLF